MLVTRNAARRVGSAVSRRGRRGARRCRLVTLLFVLGLGSAAFAQAPLDIDTADAETLAAVLPGIGPVKARRIVEHRERHGPFGGVDALGAVKGIGPVTLERIRARLAAAASGASTAPSAGGEAARSSTELERAARDALRGVVDAARRDALPYRR